MSDTGIIDAQETVDQLFGAGKAQVVEAVTSTKVTETEIIYINGSPVQLVGEDGDSLKEALMAGRIPDAGLLSRVLSTVLGNNLSNVSRIDSEVSVTSKVNSLDTLSVVKDGKVIREKTRQLNTDSQLSGKSVETFDTSHPFTNSSGTSNASSSSLNSYPRSYSRPSSRISSSPSPNISSADDDFKPNYEQYNGYSKDFNDKDSGSTSLPAYPHKYDKYMKNDSKLNKFPLDLSSLTDTLDRFAWSKKPINKANNFSTYSLTTNKYEYTEDRTDSKPLSNRPKVLDMALSQLCSKGQLLDVDQQNDYDNHPAEKPTIFGTVADDHLPTKENVKRSLPQTVKSKGTSSPPEWALCSDDDYSLVYEDGVLVSGSLNALVQHATPTATYYPDTAYLFAFLLSARLFTKPHELLQKICNIGFAQQGLEGADLKTVNKEKLGDFLPHFVQLLGQWSETFPYDFRDERVMASVRLLTHRCIALCPSLRKDVTQVLHSLLNKLTVLEQHEERLAKLIAAPPSNHLSNVPEIMDVCASALTMAQQLTHIELERLSIIGPEEFVQAFAKDNIESSFEDLKKTNNLESYVQWFNRLSYHVATQACWPAKKKHRVKVIEYWVEVARECFNIGNFNSLMGIIAGLNMSPVSRLKKTWNKVNIAKFSVLEHQMDPSSNFSSYRSTLKAAMWRSAGAVDDRQKIVIPFFSLLVKDLYFLNEGCASRLPNSHINFDKFWQLAKQVTEFMAWKQVSCPFEKVADVLSFLQTTPILTETGLALASFESESPDNNYEKERFKLLRSEVQSQSSS